MRRVDVAGKHDRDVTKGAFAQRLDPIDVDQTARPDDADAVGRVLDLVEGVGREEDGAAVGGGLAEQRAHLRLQERVEPARRLVEHGQLGLVHERLHDPDLLPVAARQLPDRAVQLDAEPLAERVAERRSCAAQANERVELFARRQPVGQAQVAGQVADAPSCRDPGAAAVQAEERCPPGRRPDQVEQQPDRRALAGTVRPEVAEDFPLLDPKVEARERRDATAVGLREAGGLDRRRGGRRLRRTPSPSSTRPRR